MAPVFHSKARHLLKILHVAGEHECLLPQSNRGNVQIHRPDPHALLPQPFNRRGRVLVKGQNLPRRKERDQTAQPFVIGHLPLDVRDPVDQRSPPAHRLFQGDDRRHHVVRGKGLEPSLQGKGRWGLPCLQE